MGEGLSATRRDDIQCCEGVHAAFVAVPREMFWGDTVLRFESRNGDLLAPIFLIRGGVRAPSAAQPGCRAAGKIHDSDYLVQWRSGVLLW